MRPTKFIPALLAASVLTASSAFANIIGFETDRGTSYAFFDKFPSTNFSGQTPELFNSIEGSATSGTAFHTPTLKSEIGMWDTENEEFLTTGGFLTGGGDRLYPSTGPSSLAARFTITGVAASFITDFTVSVKLSQPDQINWSEYFNSVTLSINGIGSIAGTYGVHQLEGLGEIGSGENARPLGIFYYTWKNINFAPGDIFEVVLFSEDSHHGSLDALQIVDAIPEPSTYLMLGTAAAGLLALRRRKA